MWCVCLSWHIFAVYLCVTHVSYVYVFRIWCVCVRIWRDVGMWKQTRTKVYDVAVKMVKKSAVASANGIALCLHTFFRGCQGGMVVGAWPVQCPVMGYGGGNMPCWSV